MGTVGPWSHAGVSAEPQATAIGLSSAGWPAIDQQTSRTGRALVCGD